MNFTDIILIICFIPAIVRGLTKGFVEQLVALLSIFLGVWLAYRFGGQLSAWATPYLHADPRIMNIVCFTVVVIVAIVILFLIGKVITGVIKIVMLGWLNRLLGLVFAMLKAALIIGLLIILFDTLNSTLGMVDAGQLESSVLYPWLRDFADTAFPYLKKLFTETDWNALTAAL